MPLLVVINTRGNEDGRWPIQRNSLSPHSLIDCRRIHRLHHGAVQPESSVRTQLTGRRSGSRFGAIAIVGGRKIKIIFQTVSTHDLDFQPRVRARLVFSSKCQSRREKHKRNDNRTAFGTSTAVTPFEISINILWHRHFFTVWFIHADLSMMCPRSVCLLTLLMYFCITHRSPPHWKRHASDARLESATN